MARKPASKSNISAATTTARHAAEDLQDVSHPASSSSASNAAAIKAGSAPLPPLTFRSPTQDELIPALTLIADSIAQQRQSFVSALSYHPYVLSSYVLIPTVVYQYTPTYTSLLQQIATILITLALVATTALTYAKWLGEKYIAEAGRVRSLGLTYWVSDDEESVREAIVAVWGEGENEKVVGVVVWDLVEGEEGVEGVAAEKRMEIVALTVMHKYRGKGLGLDLIERAVDHAWTAIGPRPLVVIPTTHANYLRVLLPTFHKHDDMRDEKIQQMLDVYLRHRRRQYDAAGKKK